MSKSHDAIYPGRPWLDTAGKRIQAHGGSMFIADDIFYWYGENKEKSIPGSDVWHWGIRCYSSSDLYNWEDRGLIIPPDPEDPDSPLHPLQKVDRPHIIYNQMTDKFVCWLKIMGEDDLQASTILTADSLLGPYEIVRSGVPPLGMSAGDFDLVVDPQTAKAYYFFEKVHTELICAELTDDYTGVTGTFTSHFPHPHPPYVREAPAHFERKGKHYLVTSGTTGYFPNPSESAVSLDYHGPWDVLGDVHPSDSSKTSFRSQISCIFRHPDKEDLYIAMADRWLPEIPPEQSNITDIMAKLYSGGDIDEVLGDRSERDFNPNMSLADYVWLPILFEDDVPRISWRDQWRTEEFS